MKPGEKKSSLAGLIAEESATPARERKPTSPLAFVNEQMRKLDAQPPKAKAKSKSAKPRKRA